MQTWGQFNIGIDYILLFKKNGIDFKLELKFPTKKLIHKLIYHLIFLIQTIFLP